MFQNIGFAILIGGFVGLAEHVRKRGKIVKPRRTKKFIYLGFLEEVLMGSLAAVLLVTSTGANSLMRVIFVSIIAGYGGDAILRALEIFRGGGPVDPGGMGDKK
ncbi:DUF4257 domain-containing protein [Mesobacillus harenae]|uniref:DUF4257 domain-containing protein n=1 Tax=Mesobacillus harenae TaxID=2213203 RepID=UPI00157FC7F7|nr:DUF4257 domain-containing protein [Mesobacillus harenae]